MVHLLFATLLVHVATVLGAPAIRASSSSAVCTSSDLKYRLAQIASPSRGYNSPSSGQTAWDLNIDDTTSGYKQTITGFGAAVTDATVSNFNRLNSTTLEQLLKELMTPAGTNFALMRHTIGASDLSPDPPYSYDENNGQPDTSLANFALGTQGTAMAMLLAQMKSYNANLTILGSPWSAPGWMKVNNNFAGNTTDNNLSDRYLSQDQSDYSSQFAQYFVQYIQAYAGLGANVDAITIQNEPLYSAAGYPTMYMYDYEQGQLIQNYVGPALQNAGLKTTVWAYDHNTDVPSYPQNVLNAASNYVSNVAWHCYAGSLDWTALTTFHNNNPGVQQYMSECWTPAPVVSATSQDWFQAANFTIGPLQNWASGVAAWTLATDNNAGPHLSGGCASCFGLVTVNDDGSYTYNMAAYVMAQFSKFIPKGSRILDGTGSSANPNAPGVQSVASRNPDGSRTVVILNTQVEELQVRLNTTAGESWSGTVPSNSIVTWVLP